MEAPNQNQDILDRTKSGLSVIILRVKASKLYDKDNPTAEEIKNACCAVDVLNNKVACGEDIKSFKSPVQPKSWVIWHGMLEEEEGSEAFDISLDFVLIKKPASRIFKKVIFYQDDGTVMAKTKNNLKKGDSEPYEITFTLVKGGEQKTYMLDPWIIVR